MLNTVMLCRVQPPVGYRPPGMAFAESFGTVHSGDSLVQCGPAELLNAPAHPSSQWQRESVGGLGMRSEVLLHPQSQERL